MSSMNSYRKPLEVPSLVTTQDAKANCPTLADYNEAEPLSYLHMFNCYSLYAYFLLKKLPVGKFKWLESNKISNFEVQKIGTNFDLFGS